MDSRIAPRVVIASRPTEWEQLLDRHATPGQARFFLETRGMNPDEVMGRHRGQMEAIAQVERAIPASWRRARVTRADFASFAFDPQDIVLAVGQDGLVPNLAKYLVGQPVIGINPDPDRHEGTLVRFAPGGAADAIAAVRRGDPHIERRTMVQARLDDGQHLLALNEMFVGHRTHQSARYIVRCGPASERQSSSGPIVATGTGATGWARSISTERRSTLPLPSPGDARLAYFVREAWPSIATGTDVVEGIISGSEVMTVVSEMESGGVVFGDGIESDRLPLGWGQSVTLGVAEARLELVVP